MREKLTFYTNRTIHRIRSSERSALQCSEVELTIRNDTHTQELRKRLKCGFDNLGNPVFCNGQILMRPDVPFMSLPFNTWSFSFYLQPWCNPLLTLCTPCGDIVNGYPGLQAMFLLLRLSHINNISELNDIFSEAFSKEDIEYGAFLGRAWSITGEWNAITASDNGPWARVPLAGKMLPDTNANVVTV
ncbi:MAG: hypothetical protein WCI51_19095, partial [Lentisphaerota bacterium]